MPTTKNLWKTYMPDGFTQTSLYTPHHSGCFIHVVVHQKSNQKGEGRGRHTLVHHSSLGHPQPKWIMLHNGIEVLIVPVPIIVSQRQARIPFVLCNCTATFNFQTSTHFRYSLPASRPVVPPLELEDGNWSSRMLERTVPSDIRQIMAFCVVTEDAATEDCADAWPGWLASWLSPGQVPFSPSNYGHGWGTPPNAWPCADQWPQRGVRSACHRRLRSSCDWEHSQHSWWGHSTVEMDSDEEEGVEAILLTT